MSSDRKRTAAQQYLQARDTLRGILDDGYGEEVGTGAARALGESVLILVVGGLSLTGDGTGLTTTRYSAYPLPHDTAIKLAEAERQAEKDAIAALQTGQPWGASTMVPSAATSIDYPPLRLIRMTPAGTSSAISEGPSFTRSPDALVREGFLLDPRADDPRR